ncbi:MAG TPA: CHAT domain-containing protein, partial [Cyanophyceae cyanobacterium]
PIVTLEEAQEVLGRIEESTGIKPVLIYAVFVPQTVAPNQENSQEKSQNFDKKSDQDQLELVLVSSKGTPIRKRIEGATRSQVLKVANQFRTQVTDVRDKQGYLESGHQLYEWLIAPLEAELKGQNIQNLNFITDNGLRSLPFSALNDGQQFLVEKYSLGLMPSLSLTDTRHQDIRNLQILAMGAAKFDDQRPLPAVPTELSFITSSLWQGKSFLNETFTLANLQEQRQQQPFGIIHLATHATFQSGAPSNSYIQLWDTKLRLNQLSQLGWSKPPVELLVLSACRTALGNEDAELGFAGLAVQAGVKSALGSLWFVSDDGTLGLMTEFYQQLRKSPIKAEALRQAQLAMIRGQVHLENGKLVTGNKSLPLPPELAKLGNKTFQHPYYWAAFTMIGNPW